MIFASDSRKKRKKMGMKKFIIGRSEALNPPILDMMSNTPK